MTRKCERPSCRERGEVAYVIDTANLLVSVDSPIPRDSSRVNVLCRRHADSLVVPRDWQIIDNRTKKQRLFSAPASQSVRTSSRSSSVKKQKREKGKTGAVIQDLFEFATRVVAAPAREPSRFLRLFRCQRSKPRSRLRSRQLIRKKLKRCRGRRSLIERETSMADCEPVVGCCREPLVLLTHLVRAVKSIKIMITTSTTQSISSN